MLKKDKTKIREELVRQLIKENCLWSYDTSSITDLPDDLLVEKVLVYLDLDEIKQLFKILPFKTIKNIWKERLVPQGDYYYTLNRFFAWYYFHAKKPDAYLKNLETRHFNKLWKA